MQLFYAPDITLPLYTLSEEESAHSVKVLRLAAGDTVTLTDGRGTLYRAVVEQPHPKHCTVRITGTTDNFERRDYSITVAVAPTKNFDRMEWFTEKAVEVGVDCIIPIECRHSERRAVKVDRLEKIAVSALKQSLKAYATRIAPLTPVEKVLTMPFEGRKLIAHCEPDAEKVFIGEALRAGENALVLIGPEGDFSKEEIASARSNGFTEISLGRSRLRTETAALTAVMFAAFLNETQK